MIKEIAYELIKSLANSVSFIDKWVGLVAPMRKLVDKKEKVFPVHINLDRSCDYSDYTSLVPDSTKTSICYCEKLDDTTFEPLTNNVWLCSVRLRIVLWYNLDRINGGVNMDEGIIAGVLLANIPRTLTNSLFTYVKNVNIYVEGITIGLNCSINTLMMK
jgi:hypothetical protein